MGSFQQSVKRLSGQACLIDVLERESSSISLDGMYAGDYVPEPGGGEQILPPTWTTLCTPRRLRMWTQQALAWGGSSWAEGPTSLSLTGPVPPFQAPTKRRACSEEPPRTEEAGIKAEKANPQNNTRVFFIGLHGSSAEEGLLRVELCPSSHSYVEVLTALPPITFECDLTWK